MRRKESSYKLIRHEPCQRIIDKLTSATEIGMETHKHVSLCYTEAKGNMIIHKRKHWVTGLRGIQRLIMSTCRQENGGK